eukprot:6193405-Pleurochrysis_carterae.AAC.4
MTWLTVVVREGKAIGLTREGHRPADVVSQLVAQRVDGKLVVADGDNVVVVADQVLCGPRRLLSLRGLVGGTPCGLAGGRIGRIGLSSKKCMHRRKLGRPGHGGEHVIHVLKTCFVGAQEAEERWVRHAWE